MLEDFQKNHVQSSEKYKMERLRKRRNGTDDYEKNSQQLDKK